MCHFVTAFMAKRVKGGVWDKRYNSKMLKRFISMDDENHRKNVGIGLITVFMRLDNIEKWSCDDESVGSRYL